MAELLGQAAHRAGYRDRPRPPLALGVPAPDEQSASFLVIHGRHERQCPLEPPHGLLGGELRQGVEPGPFHVDDGLLLGPVGLGQVEASSPSRSPGRSRHSPSSASPKAGGRGPGEG